MPGSLVHPTVLAIHLRDDGVMGGCEQYRVRIPFEQVRENVAGTVLDWAPIGKVQKWAAGATNYKTRPTDYDLWVLPRHRPLPYGIEGTARFEDIPSPVQEQIERMGVNLTGEAHLLDLVRIVKQKIAVVLEYDDDHWGSRDLGYQEHIDLARKLLAEGDAVTVTTKYMRDLVQHYAPGVPVYVLPNCVHFPEWQGHERWKRWAPDWLVIALTGSVTHYHDWIVLKDVIPRVLREHTNVGFLLQGFVPDYFEDLALEFPARVYANDNFTDYPDYPGVIRQADIVLCPVDPEDKFNHAKSSIKAIEGMASGRLLSDGNTGGAAVIASPLNYYGKAVGWGNKRGIVCDHDPDSWYAALTTMITDSEKREHWQRRGWLWVHQNRSIERKWSLWWNAYQNVYRRKRT